MTCKCFAPEKPWLTKHAANCRAYRPELPKHSTRPFGIVRPATIAERWVGALANAKSDETVKAFAGGNRFEAHIYKFGELIRRITIGTVNDADLLEAYAIVTAPAAPARRGAA